MRWLTRHRGIVVLGICLPLGYLFDWVLRVRRWLRTAFSSSPDRHAAQVREVQRQVRARYGAEGAFPEVWDQVRFRLGER